jgi:cell division protein FtsL
MNNEKRREKIEMSNEKRGFFTDFGKGIIVGFITAVIIFSAIAVVVYTRNKDKEKIEYVEQQMEIEALREDIINRDPVEFLEIPDVRRSADTATADFDRKRDEAIQRLRTGNLD